MTKQHPSSDRALSAVQRFQHLQKESADKQKDILKAATKKAQKEQDKANEQALSHVVDQYEFRIKEIQAAYEQELAKNEKTINKQTAEIDDFHKEREAYKNLAISIGAKEQGGGATGMNGFRYIEWFVTKHAEAYGLSDDHSPEATEAAAAQKWEIDKALTLKKITLIADHCANYCIYGWDADDARLAVQSVLYKAVLAPLQAGDSGLILEQSPAELLSSINLVRSEIAEIRNEKDVLFTSTAELWSNYAPRIQNLLTENILPKLFPTSDTDWSATLPYSLEEMNDWRNQGEEFKALHFPQLVDAFANDKRLCAEKLVPMTDDAEFVETSFASRIDPDAPKSFVSSTEQTEVLA